MKITAVLSALVYASVLLVAPLVFGAGTVIESETLPFQTHQTWKGVFTFSEDLIIRIEGMTDLHVLVFRKPRDKAGSVLIDFAEITTEGDFRVLLSDKAKVAGEIPVLEGIDVIPDGDKAEIIVRWKHPGNGGFRRVEKYLYEPSKLVLVARSEFLPIEGEKRWISEVDLKRRDETMKEEFPPVLEIGGKGEED